MVRLRLLHALNLIYEKRFTIHYGEIKTLNQFIVSEGVHYLQSTMVRLRRFASLTAAVIFRYLQSTMVRLRLSSKCAERLPRQRFTIHYGEIKTRQTLPQHYHITPNLQSTMVRLRRASWRARRISAENLQSTMVRLRLFLLRPLAHSCFVIYNPLW